MGSDRRPKAMPTQLFPPEFAEKLIYFFIFIFYKLILCCLVVATVFAEESTKFADGPQKVVAQKQTQRARFEDAVKGYEDAVKDEAHARAEESRAREADGGSDVFDDVVNDATWHMEEQARLLKEVKSEISLVKSKVNSNSEKISTNSAEISSVKSNQIRCVVFNGIGNYLEVGTPQKFTFSPAFESKPAVHISIYGFSFHYGEDAEGVWLTTQEIDPSGITLLMKKELNNPTTLVGGTVMACGH